MLEREIRTFVYKLVARLARTVVLLLLDTASIVSVTLVRVLSVNRLGRLSVQGENRDV